MYISNAAPLSLRQKGIREFRCDPCKLGRLPWNWVLYYGVGVQTGDGCAESCMGEWFE